MVEYKLIPGLSDKPMLKFKSGDYKSKYALMGLYPYEIPNKTNFVVISLQDNGISLNNEVSKFLTVDNRSFPFNSTSIDKFDDFFNSKLNFTYDDYKENDLKSVASKYPNSIILIIHGGMGDSPNNGRVSDEIYYLSKINAITNSSRIQYISHDHLIKYNNYIKFNLWTQLIAKCDGTPWIIDNSTLQFIDNDTIILGIAFSIVNGTIMYGVTHFIDINNMNQEVTLKYIGRPAGRGSLYLKSEELINILRQGNEILSSHKNRDLGHYRNNSYSRDNQIKGERRLKLFIYKTTPLHPEEKNAIESIIKNPKILNYDFIDVTHIHIKSPNYGIPRLFDPDNTGTNFQYMNKQGTSIGIIPDNNTNIPGFQFRGELIIGTTGTFKRGNGIGGTKGTPKPLFLSIHSTLADPFNIIKNQVMALTEMDWEYTGESYREPFIIKYARRMGTLLSYLQNPNQSNFKSNIDIRDIM
ncbi:hypothetical protein [Acidiplasma aeolicum]|jgi:hypothetical protein|uniref:hypothetical protein n=1 Tax=Acidiplasma aeolicum TaxID=507754 RepID=UPI003718C9D9